MEKEPLYDVVVYERKTNKVDAVVGNNMQYSGGYHNAEQRLMTINSRMNERYSASIVPAGRYKKGDILSD